MPSGFPGSREARDALLDLVCAGVTVAVASAHLGVSRAAGSVWWRDSGGMKLKEGYAGGGLLDPPASEGTPEGRFLTQPERRVIQSGLRHHRSYAQIGAELGRDRTVIWREVHRNLGPDGVYNASLAHAKAHERAHRPKGFKLDNEDLCVLVAGWMDAGWSPKLISLILARDHPDDWSLQLSHETLYQCLYGLTGGQLRQDLAEQLSLKRRQRKPHSQNRRRNSPYANALKISERPAEVADRLVQGHWEGDLIIGTGSGSAIGTLFERTTRTTLLLHLPERHTADAVAKAIIKAMEVLPPHLRRSITWDRGVELAEYAQIQEALDIKIYFCAPHSPWQRATNENGNRLLRHWFTKGTDLSGHSAAYIKRVQDTLNRRPRPILGLDTPAQRFSQLLLKTAA